MNDIPAKPRELAFEFNLDTLKDDPTLHSLKIEGKTIEKQRLEDAIYHNRFPFNRDEFELFGLGIFGIERVQTRIGIYQRVGKPTVRLDTLGDRSGHHRIATLEYELQEGK